MAPKSGPLARINFMNAKKCKRLRRKFNRLRLPEGYLRSKATGQIISLAHKAWRKVKATA